LKRSAKEERAFVIEKIKVLSHKPVSLDSSQNALSLAEKEEQSLGMINKAQYTEQALISK
jgi:hypothetical protein